MNSKIAIIDLGTNTFHLLIAQWDGSQFQITCREREAVKVGVGGINRNILPADGILRAVQALKGFKAIIDGEGIMHVHAFGTSAFRNADNGQEVAVLIEKQTGIRVNIITGDEEAQLICKGVCKAIPFGAQPALIVDIGGGSVEFIICTETEIFWKRSFEIGGQRLLEKFQHHDPIEPEEVKALDDYLSASLQPLLEQLKRYNPTLLAGSSGTFDTLSEIHCVRNGLRYEPEEPETPLTLSSFFETFDLLLQKNREERVGIPGMIEMRVDMIVVACCLIRFLLDRHAFKEVRVSTWSLKEGVVISLKE